MEKVSVRYVYVISASVNPVWWVVADISRNFEFDPQVRCATVISASGHILRKVVADMETWDCGRTLSLTGNSAL